MKLLLRFAALAALAALSSMSAFAQGTTAALTGTVSTEGTPLPGVTVTVASPALQGTRTAVTGEGGTYSFPALPPGDYTVTFELQGMQTVSQKVRLNLAQTSRADTQLRVATVAESITVTAGAPAVLETSQIAANFDAKTIENLPVARTIRAITLLSPGISDEGPNNQIVISGAQSFDNLFLLDGVVINENLRGQPHSLFIEDAIKETTVITGGVSAEYGRFTGGVVSTITKSGGNEFSGSLRDNLSNDNWTEKTPFPGQADPVDDINEVYEGTFGGRILRDRLWFFSAGRLEETSRAAQTVELNLPFKRVTDQTRWEGKLTGQITPKHTLVGTYTDVLTKEEGNTFGSIVDIESTDDRELPNTLLSANYSGILSTNFLLEAQYSEMNFAFVGSGANSRDLLFGTLLRDISTARRAWSPTFCGVCPDKTRDNESYLAKGTYFLSTRSFGSHNIVGGWEDFHQLRNESNFQSGSDFRVWGNFIYDKPNGKVFLQMLSGERGMEIEWDPILELSRTSDFAVESLFLNDKWDLNTKWSFNVGVRYDKAYGENEAKVKTVDDSAWSPRLAASYDLRGDGRHRFNVTYGRYVSKVDQGPANLTSTAGRPASFYWQYEGPNINGPGSCLPNCLPTDQVLKIVFDWFKSVGFTDNRDLLLGASVPGASSKFEKSLVAPHMDEITFGYGMAVGSRGYIRADYITRDWTDFYTVRRNLETGKFTDPNGIVFDQGIIENSDERLSREYEGIQLQARLNPFTRFTVGGNYTWSELTGNVEGETANSATVLVSSNNYPEYTSFAQNDPVGFLDEDIRHRANVWVQYDLPSPFGEWNFSLLERYHSGLPYSVVSSIDVRKSAALLNGIVNPGYQRPPTSVTYYFSDLGELRVDDITSTDLAINWELPMRRLRVFAQAEMLNAFNEDGIEDPDGIRQTVFTARSSLCVQGSNGPNPGKRCLAFNPFTETPVEGTHYIKHAQFGQPTSDGAYQLPRTYRFSLGVRF